MLANVAEDLTSTVEAACAALKQIDNADAASTPGAGRWSKKQIVGHLLDSAVNNHQRFVRAQQQQSGEFVFPGYAQNLWVDAQAYESSSWAELIELWRLYNRHLAHVIRNVQPEKLDVMCRIGEYEPVRLGFLIEDYLKHLRHHLTQIGIAEDYTSGS